MADPDPESEATQAAEAIQAAAEASEAAETSAATELAEVSDAAAAAGGEAAWVEAQLDGDHDTVNDQLVDSLAVIEASGQSPPLTEASLRQIKAQAVGLALLNAANAQQNAYVTANATVVATVARILALGRGVGAAADGRSAAQGAKSSG